MKNTICLFVFFALLTCSFAQQSISGIVLDAVTSAPLIGAHVSLNNGEQIVATNQEGEFSFKHLNNDAFSINTYHIGFVKKQDLVQWAFWRSHSNTSKTTCVFDRRSYYIICSSIGLFRHHFQQSK